MLAMVVITAIFGIALLLFVLSVRSKHRTIVCPIHGTVVHVRFLESFPRGRPVEVTECSAFTPPDFVTCSQRCLAQLAHPPSGEKRSLRGRIRRSLGSMLHHRPNREPSSRR